MTNAQEEQLRVLTLAEHAGYVARAAILLMPTFRTIAARRRRAREAKFYARIAARHAIKLIALRGQCDPS